MTDTRSAYGAGVQRRAQDGTVLDAWFPAPALGQADPLPTFDLSDRTAAHDALLGTTAEPIALAIDLEAAPQNTADAYLRLHLLSHLLVRPNSINLDGIFSHLPVVAWSNRGPIAPDWSRDHTWELVSAGVIVHSIDKFPRMTDYVAPAPQVRIADTTRVRLGAHLAPGTTVMHEGFVNFNAGTLGASMVEGRISQGVVVGDQSDIGGGASLMGTLSGGGTQRVSVGERSLIGANAGVGIAIGSDCVVEAGLYVTAGSKVVLPEGTAEQPGQMTTVKAITLSGVDQLLFRRNSLTGAIEALPRNGHGVHLNPELHQ